MAKNLEKLDQNLGLWTDLLKWSKTKTKNEILEVFSDSDWWVTFFNYCKNHWIERKDGKKLWYKNCMDTSIEYIDKDGKKYRLCSSWADSHEDVWAATEYTFIEISEDIEQQEDQKKDEETIHEESTNDEAKQDWEDQSTTNVEYLKWKQINWMWNYRIYKKLWSLLIIIDENNKYWVINLKWEKIVECEYDQIDSDWIMRQWDKYWLISKTWEIIKPARYDSINYNLFDKTFLVEIDWKRGILDSQWNEILECLLTYDSVDGSRKWTYEVQKDWKYWIIDNKWNIILPVQYDYVSEYSNRWGWVYEVRIDWKYWIVNGKWQIIIPIRYEQILKVSKEKYYKVKIDWKWWIIDSTGWLILPMQYEELEVISKWKYKVKSDWKWRIINSEWKTIKELQYKNSKELDRWVNEVELDDFEGKYIGKYSKYWLIDSHWYEILPVQYLYIIRINKWIYEVCDNESYKWVVDKNWVEIIPIIYKSLEVLKSDKNLFIAKNNNWKYWIINTKNEIIVPFEFDRISEVCVKTRKFWKNVYNIYVEKEWKLWQLVL